MAAREPADTKPLPAGTIVKGRYRVTRLIAGGGMAWVYAVREDLPDGAYRTWAMKELRPTATDPQALEEARTLFEQEANLLVRLRHTYLPTVSAFFQENGRAYLVMEYVRGESLERRLERANAPILENQVLDWAIQITEVLHYLHTQPRPIIFRDMKPSNVMVTSDGRIKLIDFGIARVFKQGQSHDTYAMGSENYASPEQWGDAQTDPRADIYGLGATMYHLLTNVPPLPPFVPGERVPVQRYNPAISHDTAQVIERAMAHDREDRYASARHMQTALMACLPRRDRRDMEDALTQARHPAPVSHSGRSTATVLTARAQPTRTRRCAACGAVNRLGARYCRVCGQALVTVPPPVLRLIEPSDSAWEYPLRPGDHRIGRPGGAQAVNLDLDFYDPKGYISRNHALITVEGRRCTIRDLDSTNGTFVNNERLQPRSARLLRAGDIIRMGRVVLRFQGQGG
ncbi:MAG: protein kinase domain-containing protein [Anaerolineae bacterium]